MKKRFISLLPVGMNLVIVTALLNLSAATGYSTESPQSRGGYAKRPADQIIYSFDNDENATSEPVPPPSHRANISQIHAEPVQNNNPITTPTHTEQKNREPQDNPNRALTPKKRHSSNEAWADTSKTSPQYFHPITVDEEESTEVALMDEAVKGSDTASAREQAPAPKKDYTLAQTDPEPQSPQPPPKEEKTILINFNNVNIIELLRFISKISNKNFYFDEEELTFNVTIISEEPTTIDNVMMALLQELRIHGYDMIEQGDNIIIHANNEVKSPGTIKAESLPETLLKDADIVTQVFRLNTANAGNVASMIQPMLSQRSIVEVLDDTNHIIITDINSNVEKVAQLIKSIDAPNSSLIIGQYVVRNAFMETLLQNAELILQSIAPGQTVTLIAHPPSNSIFVVSTPFLVERAIPILQRLDQTDGMTGIYNLDELRYIPPDLMEPGGVLTPEGIVTPEGVTQQVEIGPDGELRLVPSQGVYTGPPQMGRWRLDANGNWYYEPDEKRLRQIQGAEGQIDTTRPPTGYWRQDAQGNWEFVPGIPPAGERPGEGPRGSWQRGPDNLWRYNLNPGESIFAGEKARTFAPASELPLGHIERTKFLIQKLNYRLGDSIEEAMLRIADSLRETEAINADLISTISSVQWLEASNSLIFTGSPMSLLKVKELVEEIDQPLRQVFIEMLILETSVDDSLNYSVNWGSEFRQENVSGIQAFATQASPLNAVLEGAGVVGTSPTALSEVIPDLSPVVANRDGYNLGIIGQKVCAGGLEFSTLGALVRAVHTKADVNIVMNPKIITEDNVTAEIFVGINTQFKTQSVSNDRGSIITNNFEFRDVGTTLRVTPLLGPSNIITLQIEEEVSNVVTTTSGGDLSDTAAGPTTRINRTTTQVHIPDGFFLVISGMVQDQVERTRQQVPCLGGVPLLGAAFSGKGYLDQKRCLMIFLRPKLIDTEKEINDLTKHQQNIYRLKRRTKKMWKLDCEEALDWLNLKETDTVQDERSCCKFPY